MNMTRKEIGKCFNEGYDVLVYGTEKGYISEISFFRKTNDNPLRGNGFSFMSGETRQRELRRLFARINKVRETPLKTWKDVFGDKKEETNG